MPSARAIQARGEARTVKVHILALEFGEVLDVLRGELEERPVGLGEVSAHRRPILVGHQAARHVALLDHLARCDAHGEHRTNEDNDDDDRADEEALYMGGGTETDGGG